MTAEEPRCPSCGADGDMIERVYASHWAKVVMWFCKCCARTWQVHAETH